MNSVKSKKFWSKNRLAFHSSFFFNYHNFKELRLFKDKFLVKILLSISHKCNCSDYIAPNVPAIPAVADYGLLNYPPIQKITRSRKPETCTAPAIARYSMLAIGFIGYQSFVNIKYAIPPCKIKNGNLLIIALNSPYLLKNISPCISIFNAHMYVIKAAPEIIQYSIPNNGVFVTL